MPSCPRVQTNPAAAIGGPPPLELDHAWRSDGGDAPTSTAVIPLRQGRKRVVPTCALPPSDVVVARRGELGLLAPDSPQVRAVEQVDGAGLAGDGHLSVGEEDRLHRQIEIARVVRRPGGGREELEQLQRRRELEDRVAVVVSAPGRGHRTVARADPDVASTVDRGCSSSPSRSHLAAGPVPRRPRSRRASRLPRRPTPPSRGRWSSRRNSRRSRRPPVRRRG